jgi:uncharacterized protein YydD (DUF2326 family)
MSNLAEEASQLRYLVSCRDKDIEDMTNEREEMLKSLGSRHFLMDSSILEATETNLKILYEQEGNIVELLRQIAELKRDACQALETRNPEVLISEDAMNKWDAFYFHIGEMETFFSSYMVTTLCSLSLDIATET